MKKILCVGLVVVDIVTELDHYPEEDSANRFIEEDFKNYGVDIGYSVVVEGTDCPRSCVLTSLSTGSRTIVHYNKNLRELKLEEFCSIDLSQFSWINFEVSILNFWILNLSLRIKPTTNGLSFHKYFKLITFVSDKLMNFLGKNVSEVKQMISVVRDYNKSLQGKKLQSQ
ncbi:hypothetical protein Avbf_03963 [Armadillidium vulgare]|nr:hypothetical protein Avbf_03963 [Armadillidium vulgare]